MAVREIEFSNGEFSLMESSFLKDGSHISFGLDITELKNREKELNESIIAQNKAREEADRANEAKSQFLAEIPKLFVRPQIDFWTGHKSISGRNIKISFEATD